MPDILPPQLVGVQQRPLYVKVRTIVTVAASIWMVLAITGFGFFSGGTTSLALSLVLLYGTGAALIVVISAVYRLVNRSAVKRAEAAPQDTKAIVFVGTARSATEELLAALRPAAATGRPQYAPASPRTVRPAVASETTAAVSDEAPTARQPAAGQAKPTAAGQAKATAKASPKSALNKAVPNKSGKSAAAKSAKAAKMAPSKSAPAKGSKSPAKIPPAKASQAKGRPGNNNGSKSAPAKRTGSSAERSPGKKQSSAAKDSGPGPGGTAVSAQHTVRSVSAKSARPALVLASSNSVPQPSRQHIPDSRKRAS